MEGNISPFHDVNFAALRCSIVRLWVSEPLTSSTSLNSVLIFKAVRITLLFHYHHCLLYPYKPLALTLSVLDLLCLLASVLLVYLVWIFLLPLCLANSIFCPLLCWSPQAVALSSVFLQFIMYHRDNYDIYNNYVYVSALIFYLLISATVILVFLPLSFSYLLFIYLSIMFWSSSMCKIHPGNWGFRRHENKQKSLHSSRLEVNNIGLDIYYKGKKQNRTEKKSKANARRKACNCLKCGHKKWYLNKALGEVRDWAIDI